MRFHVAMARAGAVVGYRESEIYVHVPKCRLSTFMAVCRAVAEEFGVSEDDITVTTHDSRDSWIRLTVPLGAGKEVMGEEEVKAALRFDGVTDLVAEPRVVESGSEKGEQSYVKLTDKVGYKVENGELVFVYENNGSRQTLFRLDMQKVYDIYDELPGRADRNAVLEVLERLRVRVPATHVHYLMQFLASYPVFSCEIEKEGNRKVLVKRDGSVSEMRDKLSVEREVIGTPWEVG